MKAKRSEICLTLALITCLYSCTQQRQEDENFSGARSPEVRDSSTRKLQELVGTWETVATTFDNPGAGFQGTLIGTSAANGNALMTTYRQGSGDNYYEANALWAYSAAAEQIRVFETNSLGFADTHVGNFDESGKLILEYKNTITNAKEQRELTWQDDTLKMKALFISPEKTTENSFVLVRKRER